MWSDDEQTPLAFPPTREPLSHLGPVPEQFEGVYPDLLHPEPRVNVDTARCAANFKLAFEAGDTNFALAAALDEAPLAPTTWAEIACAEELFLDEFVSQCMKPRFLGTAEGANDKNQPDPSTYWGQDALVRLLARPPADPAIVSFRRRILAKLAADDALRQRFEATYVELRALREAFESDEPLGEYDSRRRRFSTLARIARAFDKMAEAFPEDEEGLGRISAYARRVREMPGYESLTQLLEHARELSTVELRLRVNAEGYVTELEILGIHEKRNNPFYRSPIGRALQKFSLWVRGYHASDTVLLAQWFLQVFEGVQAYLPPLLQLLGAMEFYLAALAFKEHCSERGLAVCFPRFVEPGQGEPGEVFEVERLFNPLLFTQGRTPISCDLRFDPQISATIVTGPNSGGKTRLLQSLAYVHLLGQSGIFAPAASARLRPASALFISLLERQTVDQAEGRLGTELLRIRELFEQARPGVLVLLDELCSGTNPQEGEEIFRLVLSLLEQLDARVFVATHFLAFARTLQSGEGSSRRSFLQVELGEDRQPTYQFVGGVANSSMAVQTAQRLGVSEAQLRRLVEQRLDS